MLVETSADSWSIGGHCPEETALGLLISRLFVVSVFVELLVHHFYVELVPVQLVQLMLDESTLCTWLPQNGSLSGLATWMGFLVGYVLDHLLVAFDGGFDAVFFDPENFYLFKIEIGQRLHRF